MTERQSVLLRLDPAVHDALVRWAGDELRSANAQIEFLLRPALAEAGRLPGRAGPMRPRGRPAADGGPEPARHGPAKCDQFHAPLTPSTPHPRITGPRLLGADCLEVLADEDVVGPVDTDVVDLVLAVAQLHDTVDDAARVGG